MELNQLEYFMTVVRMQHVTRAAEALSITQPALSHSIARLEEELGVQLFERSGRNVKLNRYGRTFAARVSNALQEIRRGKEEIAELTDPESGVMSLAFGNILGTHFIPELVHRFQEKYPNIRFELYQGTCTQTQQLLDEGRCDLNITSPGSGADDIVRETLFVADLYAVVPASHWLASKEMIGLKELSNEPFIGIHRDCGLRDTIDAISCTHQFFPRVKYSAEDLVTVAGFVAAGLGVSLLPKSRALMLEGMHWIRIATPGCVCEVNIEWKEKRYLSPAARLFRDFAIESSRQREVI